MQPLEQKSNSRIVLYLLLLLLAIGLMIGLKRGVMPAIDGPNESADTLKVAMQFCEGSFYVDSLGNIAGADYEALKSLECPFKVIPVNEASSAAVGLAKGRYDIVVGDVVYFPNCSIIYPTDSLRCKPWQVSAENESLLDLI